MKRRLYISVIVTLLTVTVTACVNGGKGSRVQEVPEPVEKADLTVEAHAWADSVAAGMDTVRLASQLFMPALYARTDIFTVRQILEYAREGIGGVVLLKGTSAEAKALADTMASAGEITPFMAIDAEWGLNMRLADAPQFPANGRISPAVQDQLMYDYGREVARECRQLGITMVLGPVLDVSDNNRFLGIRSFGADPERVSSLGLAYGRGLMDGNVLPVAKHFPGHGMVSSDSHKGKGVINASLQRMDSVDLVPFRRWSTNGMPAVMVGHLAVPAIDSEMRPAAVSRTVMTDLLRDDLGYNGLIITDAMNMLGAEGYSAADAVRAGADIIIAPANTPREIKGIVDAVRRADIALPELRQHVARILFYKYMLRNRHDAPDSLHIPETDSIARKLRG